MRTSVKLTGFLCVAVVLGFYSCSDDETGNGKLSAGAKKYLSMRMGSNNAMSQNMSGPINQSFASLYNDGVNANGRIKHDSTEVPPDSTIVQDSTIFENPWQTCAVVTELDNEDGSHTSILDYGEGCDEGWEGYKYFMRGKVTSTYLYTYSQIGTTFKNSYSYSSLYDNYGGNYNGQWSWLMNGGGTYSGESSYDTTNQQFSGNYSYADETTYQYDGISYLYNGAASVVYDQNKYIVESSNYEYKSGDSYYYKTTVLSPLVMDYSCFYQNSFRDFCVFWVYVSGRERIVYKEGDVEGSFEIDYGNGECDNIVTIYENGKQTVVDLSKDWN